MPTDYIRMIEARARQELEQLSAAQQRAIIEAYNSAGKQLVRSYRGAKDGTATKALFASYTQKIANETQQIIEQYAIKGAQIAPSVEKLIMQQVFQMAGLDTSLANDKFDNLIGRLGMESVKNIIGGKIYKDGAGLSTRIWQSSAMSSNKIQEVITAGLAQNMGAAKLSKLLQDYVNPTTRKTWTDDKIRELLGDGYAAWNKNLEYNALRLARTTLAHTATMSMRQAQRVNPYATKIMWHSVHAAGRTCALCEEMDGQVYDTDKCPFDHPNGMCYQTHEFDKSLNEMADELAAWCNGEENEMLDSWWKEMGGPDEKPKPVPKPTVQPKSKPASKPVEPDDGDDEDMDEWYRQWQASKSAAPKPAPTATTTVKSKYAQTTSSVYPGQQKQLSEFFNSQSGWRKRGLDMLADTQVKDASLIGNRVSCFRPGENTIYIKLNDKNMLGSHRYHSLLHESGHAVDHRLGIFSKSEEFMSAMNKDFDILRSQDVRQLKREISRLPGSQVQGVQDMLSSVGIMAENREELLAGHSSQYWARNSDLQGQELFAHIFESSADPGAEKVMQKYFPNAFDAVVKRLGG